MPDYLCEKIIGPVQDLANAKLPQVAIKEEECKYRKRASMSICR